ncbi:hypothetical protein N9L47_13410, partial [Rhodobacteraceae bacterium]|nr:hypothetical protein [Paracoccaceae bacterium]
NASGEFNEFIAGAYSRIYDEGGVRLDHLFVHVPKDGDQFVSATFQRLLLGCVFPDGTPGLIVLAVITDDVEIDALDDEDRLEIPNDLMMASRAGVGEALEMKPRSKTQHG